MEVEINKEILNYREGVFFGLPLRELISVLVAIVLSVIAYTAFANVMICAAVSVVPITIGFVNYHGMNGGKAVLVIIADVMSQRHLVGSKTDMAVNEAASREIVRKGRKTK